MKRILLLLALTVLAATSVLACTRADAAPARADDEPTRIITVSGTGRASMTPDLLVAQLGVEARNEDLGEAIDSVTTASNAVRDALLQAGVDREDLRTARFNINQVPRDPRNPSENDTVFLVSNILSVKIRDVDAAGDVVSAAVDAGANRVDNINFTVEDDAEARSEARRLAIEQARRHAEELADASGTRLGEILAIAEGVSGPIRPLPEGRGGAALAFDAGVPDFEPGQAEIVVTVAVEYELR